MYTRRWRPCPGNRKLATIIVLFVAQYLQIQSYLVINMTSESSLCLQRSSNCRYGLSQKIKTTANVDIVTSGNWQIAMPSVSTENLVLQQLQKPTSSRFPLPMPQRLFAVALPTKRRCAAVSTEMKWFVLALR